jgi:hypothetical protein
MVAFFSPAQYTPHHTDVSKTHNDRLPTYAATSRAFVNLRYWLDSFLRYWLESFRGASPHFLEPGKSTLMVVSTSAAFSSFTISTRYCHHWTASIAACTSCGRPRELDCISGPRQKRGEDRPRKSGAVREVLATTRPRSRFRLRAQPTPWLRSPTCPSSLRSGRLESVRQSRDLGVRLCRLWKAARENLGRCFS